MLQETYDMLSLLLIAIEVPKVPVFSCASSHAPIPWGDVKRNRWYLNMWGVVLQEWTLGLRKLESLYRTSSTPTCCFGGRHHLYLPRLLACTHSWKYTSEQRQSMPLLIRQREIRETNGELPPNIKCHSCCKKTTIALKVKDEEEWPRMTKKYTKDYDQTDIF